MKRLCMENLKNCIVQTHFLYYSSLKVDICSRELRRSLLNNIAGTCLITHTCFVIKDFFHLCNIIEIEDNITVVLRAIRNTGAKHLGSWQRIKSIAIDNLLMSENTVMKRLFISVEVLWQNLHFLAIKLIKKWKSDCKLGHFIKTNYGFFISYENLQIMQHRWNLLVAYLRGVGSTMPLLAK